MYVWVDYHDYIGIQSPDTYIIQSDIIKYQSISLSIPLQTKKNHNVHEIRHYNLILESHSSQYLGASQPLNIGPLFSYKLRYIVGFRLVEMAIATNPMPTIYRNLYENTDPAFKAEPALKYWLLCDSNIFITA